MTWFYSFAGKITAAVGQLDPVTYDTHRQVNCFILHHYQYSRSSRACEVMFLPSELWHQSLGNEEGHDNDNDDIDRYNIY